MASEFLTLFERFERYVELDFGNNCWLWLGTSRAYNGYGQTTWKNKCYRVHKLSYTIFKGPVPEGIDVLHRCDNPPCVRPSHLFLGTHLDNMKDCVKKDRHRYGEAHGNSKLTEEQVRRIRSLSSEGMSQRAISRMMHFSRRQIGLIIKRLAWKHVD
jgi:hypothetical protein